MADEKDPLAGLKSSAAPSAPSKEEPKPKVKQKIKAALELAEEPPPPARYVVRRKVTVSWGRQMLRLSEGDVVTDANLGPGACMRLREMGVDLEPIG